MLDHRKSAVMLFAIAIALIFFVTLAQAGTPAPVVALENEFIRLRVNPGPNEAGRFAVDTTGGDPSRSADDNKVLIYGSREPWTSFTTIFIDGAPHIFGGRTTRRAGLNAPATNLTDGPRLSGEKIVATTKVGDIEITQEISFARSPTTRVSDAARISYRITNRGPREHVVGLRLMLDTMLGSNDGAPLRAGGQAIDKATQLTGADLPEFWQAFDSLAQPAVISQGTLRAPGLTPPDRLEMADWGTFADAPWEFPFPSGADFTRRGEETQDTAVTLYWNPKPLAPGATRSYSTLYGVGGVSLSPAQLSLGLTAPAEVDFQYDEKRPFAVVAYVENSGGFEARGTKLSLELSEGLALAEGSAAVSLGLLQPKQTRQVVWRVLPTGKATGTLQITANVSSENLEPNSVSRDIIVNSPPQLTIKLTAPERLEISPDNSYRPNPFQVKADIANRGAQVARNLVATIELPEGLVMAQGAPNMQMTERLDPGKSITFTWSVRALGLPTGSLPISVKATAASAKPASDKRSVIVPRLTTEVRVHPAEQVIPPLTDGQPTLVPVAVKLVPARDFTGARVSVSYDPAVLEPLYVSRGDAFVEAGRLLSPWSAGRAEPGRLAGIGGARTEAPALSSAEVTLFTIVFMVLGEGESAINLKVESLAAEGLPAASQRIVNGQVTVKSAK